jgi:hypothetical protein
MDARSCSSLHLRLDNGKHLGQSCGIRRHDIAFFTHVFVMGIGFNVWPMCCIIPTDYAAT